MAKKENGARKNGQKPLQLPNADSLMEADVKHMQRYSTTSWVAYQLALRNQWLNQTIKAIGAASELIEINPSKDLFRVFCILGTRWVSHHESIRALLMIGRYGEVAALCRMLLELTDMIVYFGVYPEDAPVWRQSFSQAPSNDNQAFQAGRREFSNVNIRRKLEAKGLTPTPADMHTYLSAAIHASEWGTHLYGRRSIERPTSIDLKLESYFDPRVAFGLGFLANQTLPKPLWAFLEMCHQTGANKRVWRGLGAQYDDMLRHWEMMYDVNAKFSGMMAETEKLVADGRGQEEIQQYIEDWLNSHGEQQA